MKENVLEGSAVAQPTCHEPAHQAHPAPQSAPAHPTTSAQSESSLGLNSNVGVALVWFWWILALVFAIVEKRDRRVRVQALQSLTFMGVFYLLNIVISIVFTVFAVVMGIMDTATTSAGAADTITPVFGIFMCLLFCFMGLILIFALGVPLFGIILGLSGRELKLPVIYKWAEKLVARWSN